MVSLILAATAVYGIIAPFLPIEFNEKGID